jgi:two-component system, NtrC family, response regulator PilR
MNGLGGKLPATACWRPSAGDAPDETPRDEGFVLESDRHVLLVDDDSSVLGMLGRIAEREGIPVEMACSYQEAVALMENRRYSAVVTDVRLGTGSELLGLEVLALAKRLHAGTRVILLTGFGSPVVMERAHELEADCYFEKPVSVRVLINALKGAHP